MSIMLKNPQNITRSVPTGFSWTTLFFGFFVPLLRGDALNCILMVILATVTFCLSGLVFPFVYNKMYIKKLIEQGYVPADNNSEAYMVAKGLIASVTTDKMSKNEDIIQKLEQLSALKEKGVITEQEFSEQKNKLIKG